jgi:hypothetical protein
MKGTSFFMSSIPLGDSEMKRETEKLLRGFARVRVCPDTTVIDNFLQYLDEGLRREYDQLQKKIQAISEKGSDYKSQLEDSQDDLCYISVLGDELSILALFKDLEIKVLPFLQCELPMHKVRHLNCCTIGLVIGVCGKSKKDESECYELLKEKMRYISTFYELKCLNNSVKHNGIVNKELADNFGDVWGKEGDELKDIRESYERLKLNIFDFCKELVDKVFEEKGLKKG